MILFAACKKDKTHAPEAETPPITQPTSNTANIEAIINNLGTPLETFTMNVANGTYYTCNNGTHILINPNSFMTPGYELVTGIVTITVKDILSKKDMILNNAFPVSNGNLLVSGGQLYFSAKQGNNSLRPNPDSPVYVSVPTVGTPSGDMKLFVASSPSNLSQTNLNWMPNNSNILLSASTPGTPANEYGYDLSFSDSIHWTNCDHFYNAPVAKTTCTVLTSGVANSTNTIAFISMNGQRILARLYPNTSTLYSFASYSNSIPIGSNYTIGVICYDGTNYYYGSQQMTMTADMIIQLPPLTQATRSEVLANLSALQ
ncbi:MAG: hypothetical protein V4506_04875 [Bacteroidota bacterium]